MINKAIEFAREIFERDASGHDFDHTMRVYRMAVTIAEETGADVQTVSLASLLHDVDDRKLSPQTCQNKDRAVGFLRGNGLDEGRISRIVQIISEISFSSGAGKPSTLEGCCVQDADRLDAIGAIGIARAFAYGGHHNRLMYHPDQAPNLNMSREEYIHCQSTTINHFYEKLFRLTALMNTRTAKEIATARDEYMRQYMAEFMDEWEGNR